VTGSSFHFSKNTSFTLNGDYHSYLPRRYNHKEIIAWLFSMEHPIINAEAIALDVIAQE